MSLLQFVSQKIKGLNVWLHTEYFNFKNKDLRFWTWTFILKLICIFTEIQVFGGEGGSI